MFMPNLTQSDEPQPAGGQSFETMLAGAIRAIFESRPYIGSLQIGINHDGNRRDIRVTVKDNRGNSGRVAASIARYVRMDLERFDRDSGGRLFAPDNCPSSIQFLFDRTSYYLVEDDKALVDQAALMANTSADEGTTNRPSIYGERH